MSRTRGSGSRAATTMSNWSALATMIRSIASVSSALRRKTVRRGATRTIRASVPSPPVVSPTRSTRSPVTSEPCRSSLARVAVRVRSSVLFSPMRTVYRPRSTASTVPTVASECSGRVFVRGRGPRGGGRIRIRDSSKSPSSLSLPPPPPPPPRPSPRPGCRSPPPATSSRENPLPQPGELRQCFRRAGDIVHDDARHDKTQERPGCCHPMIGVTAPSAVCQWRGFDVEAVVEFSDAPAEPVHLGCERRKPVGFMVSDMTDAGDRRRSVGKRGEGNEVWHQFARLGQVKINGPDASSARPRRRPGDGDLVTGSGDRCPEPGQDCRQSGTDLDRGGGPSRNCDRATDEHRGNEERRSIGEVGLNVDLCSTDRSGAHSPVSRLGTGHLNAAPGQRCDGHIDVRDARETLTGVLEINAVLEPGSREQHAGDELAGAGGIHLDRSSGERAATVHGEGEVAAPVIGDIGTDRAQRLQEGSHRAAAGGGVTVKRGGSQCEGSDRGKKSHDGAGEAALDGGGSGEFGGGNHSQVVPESAGAGQALTDNPEGAQCLDHELTVARPERRA